VENQEHLTLLRAGSADWNRWRAANPRLEPDLGGFDLGGIDLRNFDLQSVNFGNAQLVGADFRGTKLMSVAPD
jgi:uncharacterized protein YjbI with pentapeptide repeats